MAIDSWDYLFTHRARARIKILRNVKSIREKKTTGALQPHENDWMQQIRQAITIPLLFVLRATCTLQTNIQTLTARSNNLHPTWKIYILFEKQSLNQFTVSFIAIHLFVRVIFSYVFNENKARSKHTYIRAKFISFASS